MSCIISKVQVFDLNYDKTKTKVSAGVKVFFTLDEEGHYLFSGEMNHNISISVRKGAPEGRIMKKLRAAAALRQHTYFEGEGDKVMNIFENIYDSTLSAMDEIELQKELRSITQDPLYVD